MVSPLRKYLMIKTLINRFYIIEITHILYDPQDMVATISALLALLPLAFLNTYLKQLIQQPRPSPTLTGYGMPSNHAQFISYLAGYLFMWHFYRAQGLPKRIYQRNIIVLLILVVSVCFSRVYLQYHSIWQVIVGFFVGVTFSILWFSLISALRWIGIVDGLLHSRLNTYLYIKDTMNEEHQRIQKEWTTWKDKQAIFGRKRRYT
ncbi:hypothetical protein PCK2_000149 [Pneumocystis canis]|nr:hypothetical protein PCK2_000149 [Pneumocystis canis]